MMRKERYVKALVLVVTAVLAISLSASTAVAAVTGFVASGRDGELYEYDYNVLLDSYVSLILGSAAPIYSDYSKKSMYAFLDETNGYIDYNDVLDAYVKAILDNRAFDTNKYTASAEARRAAMPGEVYVVTLDSSGKLTYTKKILKTTADVVAALQAVNGVSNAAAMKKALLDYDDPLELNLNRYSLTSGELDALASRLLPLKPYDTAEELQRILHTQVIAIRGGLTIKHTRYNYTLDWMADKQMTENPQTDLYGGGWKSARRDDVAYYLDPYNFIDMEYGGSAGGSIRITADPNLRVRQRPTTASPQLKDDGGTLLSVWNGQVYAILGQARAEAGTDAGTEGTWYKIRIKGKEGWVCGKYCQITGGSLSISSMFQFLCLSGSAGSSVGDLNKILNGKGILSGQGGVFMEAARENKINEIFLVSLALHESGNGRSDLATGVLEVEDINNHYPGMGGEYTRKVQVTADELFVRERPTTESSPLKDAANKEIKVKRNDSFNILAEQNGDKGTAPGSEGLWYKIKASGKEGWVCGAYVKIKVLVKVYNMFGIGAIDDNPNSKGAQYAYNECWFTPEAAIRGGAKFAANSYVNRPSDLQNTLYKMRWNPNNPATHQYATDIGWAAKQVTRIKDLYDQVGTCNLTFDIPRFKE